MLLVAVVAFAASDLKSASLLETSDSSASPDTSQDVWEHQMEEAGRQGSWADLDDQIKKEGSRAKDALSDFEAAFPSIQADRNGWQPVHESKPAAKKATAKAKAKASSFAEVGQVDDLLAPQQIALLERKSKDAVAQTWGDINAFRRQAALMKEELHRPGTTIAGAIARVRAEMGTSFIEMGEKPETYMGYPMDRAAEQKEEHAFAKGRDEAEKKQLAKAEDHMKKAAKDFANRMAALATATKNKDWSEYEDDDLRAMRKEAAKNAEAVHEAEDKEAEALSRDLPEDHGDAGSLLETPQDEETKMEADLRQKQRQITLQMADDLKRIQAAERKARGAAVSPSGQLELSLIASKAGGPDDSSQAAQGGAEEESADNKAMREENEKEADKENKEEECDQGDNSACSGTEAEKTTETEEKKEKEMGEECDDDDGKDCAKEQDKKDGVTNKEKDDDLNNAVKETKQEEERDECESENGDDCESKGVQVEKTAAQKEDEDALEKEAAAEKKQKEDDAKAEQDEEDGAEASEEVQENEAAEQKRRDEDRGDEADSEGQLTADMAEKDANDAQDAEEDKEQEDELQANMDASGDEGPEETIKTTAEEESTTGPSDDPKDKEDDRTDDGEDEEEDEPGDATSESDALTPALMQQALVQRDEPEGPDMVASHVANALRNMQENHEHGDSDEGEKGSRHSHKKSHHRSRRDDSDDSDRERSHSHKKKHDSDEEAEERKEAEDAEHDEDGVFAAENEVDKTDATKKEEQEIDGVETDIEAEAKKEGKELPAGFKEQFKHAAEEDRESGADQLDLQAEDEAEARREAAEEREVDTQAEEANDAEQSDGSPDIDIDPMAKQDEEEDRAAKDSLLQTEPLPTGQIYDPVAPQMRGIDDLNRATAGLRQFSKRVEKDFGDTPPPTQEATRSGADLLDDALSDLRREDH